MKKLFPIVVFSLCMLAMGSTFFLYVQQLQAPPVMELKEDERAAFQEMCSGIYAAPLVSPPAYQIPADLSLHSGAAILIDASSGAILYEKNADAVIPPASMTKLVVMYVVFQEIATGSISLDDVVPLPPESWAVNAPPMSSLMFLGQGQTVTLRELLLGLAVASGNDAAIAVASYVSGSVESFVQRMNREMELLGLERTRFVEPSGYSELNLTTPREFAAFARVYATRYPEALSHFHSRASISYPLEHNLAAWHQGKGEPPITQQNTNKLLSLLPGCDGLKTGFIFESGYNLSLTAKRQDTRFISVTMRGPGSGTAEGNRYRIEDATTLMEWAFTHFSTYFKDEVEPMAIPVVAGMASSVAVAPLHSTPATVPLMAADGQPSPKVSRRIHLPKYVTAPVAPGQQVGTMTFHSGDLLVEEVPLVAVRGVEEGNAVKRLLDRLAIHFL